MSQQVPKWKRQPDERPAQIIEAALDVFAQRGYKAATMQEIAEAAGITKGTIYLYFRNKLELFIATIREQFDDLARLLPEIRYEPGQDPETLTRTVGRAFLDVLMTPKMTKVLPLVIGEYQHIPALRELYFAELFSRMDVPVTSLIEMGKSLGIVREVNPAVAARCLLGAFFVCALTQEVFGARDVTPMEKDEMADTIATIYFKGLLKGEQGA